MAILYVVVALLGMAGLTMALFAEHAPHWLRWIGGALSAALLVAGVWHL